MAATPSRRLGLHGPSGGDPADIPGDVVRLRDQLDLGMLGYAQGSLSARPAAGVEGRMYYATDDAMLYYDFGTGWMPASFQPGWIQWTAVATDPPVGWERCWGQALSRTRYAALFRAIGTWYGAGDGSTTFNVPDLRGRVPILIDAGAGRVPSAGALGASGGEAAHRLTVDEMPTHNHYNSTTTATDMWEVDYRSILLETAFSYHGQPGYTATDRVVRGDHYHNVNVTPEGGNVAHNNMPPYLALNAWIKT